MFQSERSVKDFLMGIVIGGSLGAMLINTKPGKKVQKEILDKYHELSKSAHELLGDKPHKKASKAKKRKPAAAKRKKRK